MSTDTYTPQVLVELRGRALGSSIYRDAWLAARRTVITATEAKVFLTGSVGDKHTIIREKVSGESSFKGNKYTENGNRREPHIIDWLSTTDGWEDCGILYHSADNARHAATPDAIRITFDEAIELAEIKTSKNDVSPGSEHFDRAGYYLQMQWQMWCTGASRVLYVWEQHNDDWSRWPEIGPEPLGEPLTQWIERDENVIRKLRRAADTWLVKLDEALASAPVIDPVLDALAVDVLEARALEASAKAAKDAAWKQLQGLLSERGELSQRSSSAQVTWTPAGESMVPASVVDEEAARAAHGHVWAKVFGARQKAEAAEREWAELLVSFTTVTEEAVRTSAKLTVTAVKKGADA